MNLRSEDDLVAREPFPFVDGFEGAAKREPFDFGAFKRGD